MSSAAAKKPFHLAYFLGGSHIQGWGLDWSGNIADEYMTPDLYVMVAQELERGGLDYILLEDNVYVPDTAGGKMDFYLKNGVSVPRRDPLMVAPFMIQATKHIGIVPTISTFAYHPYLLARLMASLDQLSNGRIGWNMVTGSSDRAVQNFGFDAMLEHDERYDQASEFVDCANALWDSWEPGAMVANRAAGVLIDPSKVHVVDFEGKWYKSRGPLNVGPTPQGRPTMAQAGSSPRGRAFAAKYSDTIVGEGRDLDYAKRYREELRELAVAGGRNPDEVQLMTLITPIIGASEGEAAEKLKTMREYSLERVPETLAVMSKSTGIDFSAFHLDEPLSVEKIQQTNGTRGGLDTFLTAAAEGKSLRQTVADRSAPNPRWVGTPEQIADNMEAAMEHIGGDGFLLAQTITRRYIAELVDGLIPVLQRRGLTRTEYRGKTLRENLHII